MIPSREANLPNNALEAHAFAPPVRIGAYRTRGLMDIVDDFVT